jgi:hypothetical protein
MSEQNKKSLRKYKRVIPTRLAGTPANSFSSNPADELLEQAFGKQNSLDSQTTQNRLSKDNLTGYPKPQSLDSLIAKEETWLSKKTHRPAIKLSKEISLDSQISSKPAKWSKYDKTRNRKGIFLRTDDELTKQFKKFCIDNDLEFSQATELAWVQFMERLAIQTTPSLDSLIAHDDRRMMISWKTKGHIINLYLRYNLFFNPKSRWNVRDDEKGNQFNNVDLRVVELGIIQTQFQKNFKGKINSFGYYENEINNFAELGMNEEVLNTMLKINRQRWQQATGKVIDYSEFEIKAETTEN